MNLEHIESLVKTGGAASRVRGVYGRVVRTGLEEPVWLSDDHDRRVVMIMGPSGISKLLGKSGMDMVKELGHTCEYIQGQLNKGRRFVLVVFRKRRNMRVATWNNVIKAVSDAYPEVAHLLKPVLSELKRTPFRRFEKDAGFSFAAVHDNGPADPRFMTAQRLLTSDGSALSVRRFLYHTVRLTSLYSGDGYTRTEDGRRGVREYVAANRRVDALGERAVVDLAVAVSRCGR